MLWEVPTNSSVIAPPTTLMVDGRQYTAFVSGCSGNARNLQARFQNTFWEGETPPIPEGAVIWVFTVE